MTRQWVGVRCLSSQRICVCVYCRRLCVYFVHHQGAATLSYTVKISHISQPIRSQENQSYSSDWLVSVTLTADNFVCSGPFLFKMYECDCHFRGGALSMRGLVILKILLMNIFIFLYAHLWRAFSQFREFWVGVGGATCKVKGRVLVFFLRWVKTSIPTLTIFMWLFWANPVFSCIPVRWQTVLKISTEIKMF